MTLYLDKVIGTRLRYFMWLEIACGDARIMNIDGVMLRLDHHSLAMDIKL